MEEKRDLFFLFFSLTVSDERRRKMKTDEGLVDRSGRENVRERCGKKDKNRERQTISSINISPLSSFFRSLGCPFSLSLDL